MPNAEVVSNSVFIRSRPSAISTSQATTFSATNAIREMKKALATTSAASRRLKITVSSSPRTVAHSAASVIENVVVFTPPPVLPGDAPMNISAIITNSAGASWRRCRWC